MGFCLSMFLLRFFKETPEENSKIIWRGFFCLSLGNEIRRWRAALLQKKCTLSPISTASRIGKHSQYGSRISSAKKIRVAYSRDRPQPKTKDLQEVSSQLKRKSLEPFVNEPLTKRKHTTSPLVHVQALVLLFQRSKKVVGFKPQPLWIISPKFHRACSRNHSYWIKPSRVCSLCSSRWGCLCQVGSLVFLSHSSLTRICLGWAFATPTSSWEYNSYRCLIYSQRLGWSHLNRILFPCISTCVFLIWSLVFMCFSIGLSWPCIKSTMLSVAKN